MKKKSSLIISLLITILGFGCYFFISINFQNHQEEQGLKQAEYAMGFAERSIGQLGDVHLIRNELYAGETSLHDNPIVNEIRSYTGYGATIFNFNTRVSTTATAADSIGFALGTTANEEITKKVAQNGEEFKGITNTLGKDWLIYYKPLKNQDNQTIGMISVFEEYGTFLSELATFKIGVAISIIILVFFVILLVNKLLWNEREILKLQEKILVSNKELEKQKEELTLLSIVASETNQSISIYNKEDKIIWVNPSFERNFGFSKEELIGKIISKLITGPKSDLEIVKKMGESIFIHKAPFETSIILYRKNGTSYWAKVYLSPILDKDGEIDKYIAIETDISAEKAVQDELIRSEANFRQISEVIEEIIYLYNVKEKKYEYLSPHSKKVLGVSPNYFYLGKDYKLEYIHPDDYDRVSKSFIKIQEGESFDVVYRIIVNGEVKWVREQSYPVMDENGNITKNTGTIQDITARVAREKQIENNHKNTKIISEIGIEIGEKLHVDEITKSIYSRLNKIMDAEFFGIGIVDNKKNVLSFPMFIENGKEMSGDHSLDANELAAICVNTVQDIFISDIINESNKYTDKPLVSAHGGHSMSILYIPIKEKDKVKGVVTVQSRSKFAYSEIDVELLRNISVFISRALTNIKLYESLEEQVKLQTKEVIAQKEEIEVNFKDAKLLADIGSDLSSSLRFEEIFEKLHKNVDKLLDAEIFGIRILNLKKQTVEYQYGIESGVRNDSFSVSLADLNNYTVWCITNNKSVFINDNQKEYKNYVEEIIVPIGKMPDSLLFVPILNNDIVIGAITVQSFDKNAYSERHLVLMKTLAFYTGIALSNAHLYETLEDNVERRTFELKIANKEVLDSITYTKNIQYATLPNKKLIEELLPNSFVYYQPKNIVSGDFYRVDKVINANNEELIVFSVADCTGHGVPGACLAILCSSILKQALTNINIRKPSDALDYARNSLKTFFEHPETRINDGMDVSFGVLHTKTNVLEFSGAFNNCHILRENEDPILLKGDRMHVGYSDNHTPFTTETIQLQSNDSIFMTTDGFPDQFGGDKNKKFGRKKLLELFKNIEPENSKRKIELLQESFINWKGDEDQTDDICILGFKLD